MYRGSEIHRPQDALHPGRIIICAFGEDEDLGMVIHGKCFFRPLVIDPEFPNRWVILKDRG